MQVRSHVASHVARQLNQRTAALAQEWVDRIEQAQRERSLFYDLGATLREDVEELVRMVIAYMRDPGDRARTTLTHAMKLHVDRRRQPGYDMQQVLAHFQHLARLMFRAFVQSTTGYADAHPAEIATLACRLHDALMLFTSEGVGMVRASEREQQQRLAHRLAQFARTLGHELKNPLGAAQAGAHMLRDASIAQSAADRDRFIRLVLRNLVRVQDLIHDIRALALADENDRRERWTRLDELVPKVFEELAEDARKANVDLAIDGALPSAATVDATRFEIALVNLVGNAIKYCDREKPERHVRLRAEPRGDGTGHRWIVSVRDNGLGIPAALHARLLNEYVRAHADVAEGTGLGLVITRELVTSAGGRVWFESVETKGTTFYLEIPDGGDRRTAPRRRQERRPARHAQKLT